MTTANQLINAVAGKFIALYGIPALASTVRGEFRVWALLPCKPTDAQRLEFLYSLPSGSFLTECIEEYDRLTNVDPKNTLVLEHIESGESMLARGYWE